jgi:predicted nucleic acid-binding protein
METQPGDILFLDTNVLLTATDESRAHHGTARQLLAKGRSAGLHGAVSGQIIREYLVVATRPVAVNGLGLTTADAIRNMEQFTRRVAFCDETEATSVRLRGLVRMHDLAGKAIHDANVVAAMACHGIQRLVTENPEDFRKYPEISALRLEDVAERLAQAPHQG